ncbi:MAG: sulfotransferase family protein [Terriglobales bacterium]
MRSPEVAAWTGSVPLPTIPKYKQSRAWRWVRQTWLGDLSRGSRTFCREMWAWVSCKPVRFPEAAELAESIATLRTCGLDATAPEVEVEEEAPIFLLSTGWRAGSTLLQRILITDPRLLLWGEPLGDMTVISRMAEMVSHSISPLKLRVWESQVDANSSALATSWIANLYPPSSYLRKALRSLVAEWLAKPARDRGFARWGLKECRLGATEATLLHWLYPNAKFVVISRHPYDSYRSLADAKWAPYYRYPDVRVNSAATFAHHWNRLAVSWSDLPAGFPCFQIKYEDLADGKVDFRKLESWLGIEVKENIALSVPVGGTRKREHLTWYERSIIAREAAAGMRALGYSQ